MKQETKDKVIFGLMIGSLVTVTAVCTYLGVKDKNKFAKYVMEHPEEYKRYQDVEKVKSLEASVNHLTAANDSLTLKNRTLTNKNEELTERLKGFVKKEYAEFFDTGSCKDDSNIKVTIF